MNGTMGRTETSRTTSPDVTAHRLPLRVSGPNGVTDQLAKLSGHANRFVAKLHDRMPVILEPEQFEAWLTGAAGLDILKPAADHVLQCWPVSQRVNSSHARDDDVSLIEPAALGAAPDVQESLGQRHPTAVGVAAHFWCKY